MVQGLNHITLSVRNIQESYDFYRNVLGFVPLMKSPQNAYFLAGNLWFCIEEDPLVRNAELPEYTHISFSVKQENFEDVAEKVRESGAKIFKENKSEGDSLYFIDPNGHKLEIHVGDWKSRMNSYKEDATEGTEFFEPPKKQK